jgi:hypothetical protein
MNAAVAPVAKRDQILLGILTPVTTESFVVNFKIGHRPARLASPAIPAKHLITELLVRLGIKP